MPSTRTAASTSCPSHGATTRLDVAKEEELAPTRWSVSARGVREHRIALGWNFDLSLREDHPLLWPHAGPRASMYFTGRPSSPAEAAGRLWLRHHLETEGWLPFERFLNAELPLAELLDGGAGLLAAGPVRLLRAYGAELDGLGVAWSIAGEGPPRVWDQTPSARLNETRPLPEGKAFRVLTLGDSYVVAAEFTAARA